MQARGRQYFRKLLNLGLMVGSVPIQNLSSYPILKKGFKVGTPGSPLHLSDPFHCSCLVLEWGNNQNRKYFLSTTKCVNAFVWTSHLLPETYFIMSFPTAAFATSAQLNRTWVVLIPAEPVRHAKFPVMSEGWRGAAVSPTWFCPLP